MTESERSYDGLPARGSSPAGAFPQSQWAHGRSERSDHQGGGSARSQIPRCISRLIAIECTCRSPSAPTLFLSSPLHHGPGRSPVSCRWAASNAVQGASVCHETALNQWGTKSVTRRLDYRFPRSPPPPLQTRCIWVFFLASVQRKHNPTWTRVVRCKTQMTTSHRSAANLDISDGPLNCLHEPSACPPSQAAHPHETCYESTSGRQTSPQIGRTQRTAWQGSGMLASALSM